MSTRRFQDDMAEPPPSEPTPKPAMPARMPRSVNQQAQQIPQARPAQNRNLPHMPRTLSQVLNDANDQVVRGDLSDYVPLPTGFDPLDGLIGAAGWRTGDRQNNRYPSDCPQYRHAS